MVKGLDRECRDERGALQRDKFYQQSVLSRGPIECTIDALERTAGCRENIEALQNDLAVDQHIELSHTGFLGRWFLKLQCDSVAAAGYRYAIGEGTLPETVVD